MSRQRERVHSLVQAAGRGAQGDQVAVQVVATSITVVVVIVLIVLIVVVLVVVAP